jgi:tetratricopeptide (TPR) repeat protein
MSSRRFRVAFSFAGAKRDFVAKVAGILAKKFSPEQILYDKYHEADFARPRLGRHLPKLYHKQADLVVVVLCKDYAKREWPGLEWDAIFDLIKKRLDDGVMLCRFNGAKVAGLYSDAGYVELDKKTPKQAAALILERLALNEGNPKDQYVTTVAPPSSTRSKAKPRKLKAASRAKAAKSSIPKSLRALSTPIRNNLPHLQPFFGREKELARIREVLAPSSRAWLMLIDGPGGMGKTSLAIRAAYECPLGSFERIIFVSVKDWEMDDDGLRVLNPQLLSGLHELFSSLARELGLTEFGKSVETDRPKILLDALQPLKALLVLDNLESLKKSERDQLFNFVKHLPAGCKAILTSRRRLGAGAELLILERLDESAALEMLDNLAKGNPLLAKASQKERLDLYEQTAGKPLLLRWTAGQLGRGHCRTIADAIAYLRSCPKDNDPLEFIFGDLVQDFTDAETKVLCALTYFTQPATVEHIATVAGAERRSPSRRDEAPPSERRSPSRRVGAADEHAGSETGAPPAVPFDEAAVETALRTLANRSLVVPDQEERAYTLVPMVADFLRKKKPGVVAEIGNRLENRAFALIVKKGLQKHDRLSILEAAWPTVAPAIPLFLSGPNSRLQTICDALPVFLNFTGRWDEWLALTVQAETRALAAGDPDKAGWRAYDAGWVHCLRQQGDAVLACAGRAAAHWTQAQAGPREQAAAIGLRGLGHRLQQDYTGALADARQAVELLRSVSAESEDMASALCAVADIERHQGDYDAAEQDWREALRIARAVGDAEGVAIYTGNLAGLALDREDWPTAEKLALEALPLSEKVGRKELVAANNLRIAVALVPQSRKAEALPHAERSVQLYTQLGSPTHVLAQAILKECQA